VPILGVVENMSFHVCSGCGETAHIFGDGGAARVANRFGIDVLGNVPLARPVRESGDAGAPIVIADPASAAAKAFESVAAKVAGVAAAVHSDHGHHHGHDHA
jgi:ATP-binding protein involved in chromosome partitioning